MPEVQSLIADLEGLPKIFVLLGIALVAIVLVHAVRRLGQALLSSGRTASVSRGRAIATLLESAAVFGIGATAVGLVLQELGISLTAYLASVSVIGLAVGFGSQGLVQDVVTGLTVVVSDAFDVGDMVEISGQTGTVRTIGLRFTTLTNFVGAEVLVPNRNIASIVAYPKGYMRAIVDAELPADAAAAREAEQAIASIAQDARAQFPAVLVAPHSIEGRFKSQRGAEILRVRFRLWPGQGTLIETIVRQRIIAVLRALDPAYPDWKVAVTYRAEPGRRLPNAAAEASA